MSLMALTCPHCHVENVQFKSVAATWNGEDGWTTFYVCNSCKGGIVADVARVNSRAPDPHAVDGRVDEAAGAYLVRQTMPRADPPVAPAYTPDRVARYFLQAVRTHRAGDYDAAGAMCRKAIEAGIFALDEKLTGALMKRIDALAAAHEITPALQQWAHAIRLDGNEAVHGDDFTDDQAEQIVSFAELFLMYVFTLPGMLAERKAKQTPASG